MYAIAKDQTKSTTSGTVKLNFHHILSQVAFRAKTQSEGMQVDIKEIKSIISKLVVPLLFLKMQKQSQHKVTGNLEIHIHTALSL